MQTIVTEDDDKKQEEERIRQALSTCGYPKWTVDKVKKQMATKAATKPNKAKKRDPNQERPAGMVVLPYIQGVSERVQRTLKKYRINSAMKPHNT